MISEAVAPVVIVKILAAKVIIGMISGLVVEFLYVGVMKKHEKEMDIHVVCEEEHCSCEDGIFRSAFKHTLKIFAYILIISFLLNVVIGFIGEDTLAAGWLRFMYQDMEVMVNTNEITPRGGWDFTGAEIVKRDAPVSIADPEILNTNSDLAGAVMFDETIL